MRRPAGLERWDRWARTYDRGLRQRLFFRPLHAQVVAALSASAGERVLDVGAGTGSVVARLAAAGTEAYGADPSGEMARVAHGKAPGRFVVARAEHLPFADGTFDAVLTSVSMHHWESAERGMAELFRVLRPGGRALVADIEARGVLRYLAPVLARFGHDDARYLGRNELASIMVAAGLRPTRRRTFRRRILLQLAERR